MVLITSFDDISYVRQKLVYDLWAEMADFQDVHRLTPRTFFAVVYINGEYQGLYTGCDRIDDEFVRHMGFEDGEGNLYKAVSHDANFKKLERSERQSQVLARCRLREGRGPARERLLRPGSPGRRRGGGLERRDREWRASDPGSTSSWTGSCS